MAHEIFISYRREDNPSIAHLLAFHFRAGIGNDSVFLDVNSIEAGANVRARLKKQLKATRALVAVIGPHWMETGPSGKPRLFEDDDFVKWEIATAFENEHCHIFPVLDHRAELPQVLPREIEGLRDRNRVKLHPTGMDQVIRKLVGDVKNRLERPVTIVQSDTEEPSDPVGGARGRFAVSLCPKQLRKLHWLHPGAEFRDLAEAPLMVVLPPREFEMGVSLGDPDAGPEEEERHKVLVERQFALGRHPVSIEEWNAYASSGHGRGPVFGTVDDRDRRKPVAGITWDQAQSYVQWLSDLTEQPYRLPSEAEWEYAARAGEPARYWWGASTSEIAKMRAADAAGRFPPNKWGLCGMLGTVAQWVEDDWHGSYRGAPANAKPWRQIGSSTKVLRGGSERDPAKLVRSSARASADQSTRGDHIGFRVARSLVD